MREAAGAGEFEDAFDRLFALAYRAGYRVLGDRGQAEDVAQEALARALVRWPQLRRGPEGWVVRVSVNLAIDRWRSLARHGGPGASAAVPEPPPAASPAHRHERVDLARALRRLPRRQREVVVLRYLADWSEQEVAVQLGCSVGAVKSNGSRGLAKLRRAMGPAVEGDGSVRTP